MRLTWPALYDFLMTAVKGARREGVPEAIRLADTDTKQLANGRMGEWANEEIIE